MVASLPRTDITGPQGPPGEQGLQGIPGAPGGSPRRSYLAPSGSANQGYSTPDDASLDLTTKIELRALIQPASWTPAAGSVIIGKWLSTGNQLSYRLQLGTTGTLQFLFSPDGTTSQTATSNATLSNTVLKTRGPVWVRSVSDLTPGGGGSDHSFYYSLDGAVTWIQLGTTVHIATAGPAFSGTALVRVARTGTDTNRFSGRIYMTEVWDATSNTLVGRLDVRAMTTPTTYVDATGKTWTNDASAALLTDEVNDLDFLDKTLRVLRLVPGLDAYELRTSNGDVKWMPGLVFNIVDYGATTASSDNTAAIGLALAEAVAAGGGVIYVPPGTWMTNLITITTSNITIAGAGKGASILKLRNAQNTDVVRFTGGSCNNCTVTDLTADGNISNQTAGTGSDTLGHGFSFLNGTGHTTIRAKAINTRLSGIFFFQCADSHAVWSRCDTNGSSYATKRSGIQFLTCTDSSAISSWSTNQTYAGIHCSGTGHKDMLIAYCTVKHCQFIGIAGGGGALPVNDRLRVIGNTVDQTGIVPDENDGNCIDVGGCTNVTVADNTTYGGRDGIDVDGGDPEKFANNVTITGNVIRGNLGRAGITCINATGRVIVANNVCTECAWSGIQLNKCPNATVTGNTCSNNSQVEAGHDGITIIDSSDGTIVGNRCYDDQVTKTQVYGIRTTGTSDRWAIGFNSLTGNLTGPISTVGANNQIGFNT